jgi:transposase-like protein
MDESEDRAEALRLRLASRRDSRRRVPEELRAEAIAFAKAEHASGKRYKSIASALGVKAETLMRWCRAHREPKKFARVVVKRAARAELTVHGPAGTRIEELTIQQVVDLLRALSCSD